VQPELIADGRGGFDHLLFFAGSAVP
jgi:hypothetical protein